MPSLLAKMKVLLIVEENSWEVETKRFLLCAISHENYLVSDILWVIASGNLFWF